MSDNPESELAVILYADVAGYSRLTVRYTADQQSFLEDSADAIILGGYATF